MRGSGVDSARKRNSTFKYGFYFHTFNQPVAGVQLLRQLRSVYPDEPVYVSSDGGMNFSGICAEIGHCHFQWLPPANDRYNPYPFFNRFRDAARWLSTEFVVMLEPDNEIRGRARADPKDDAGGVYDSMNAALPKTLLRYLTEKGRNATGNPNFEVKWTHFGLCGGSYFRTEAVLESFDPDSLDWKALAELEPRRVWSSDVAMAMALAVHGYSYYPWEEVTQTRYGLSKEAAYRHYGREEGKPGYSTTLVGADQNLVTDTNVKHGNVFCHGCVWVPDDVCWQQSPVRCPTTEDK